jgi:hypothetical protein
LNVHAEELTPEEMELCRHRSLVRANLRGVCKAQHGGKVVCTYCRAELSQSQTHLSHIVPLSQGGRTDTQNVVLACGACCESKHCRNLEDWLSMLDSMRAEVQRLLADHPQPMPAISEAPKEEAATEAAA